MNNFTHATVRGVRAAKGARADGWWPTWEGAPRPPCARGSRCCTWPLCAYTAVRARERALLLDTDDAADADAEQVTSALQDRVSLGLCSPFLSALVAGGGPRALDASPIAANFAAFADSVPLLSGLLNHHDQKVLEHVCLGFARLVDGFALAPPQLEMLAAHSLLPSVVRLISAMATSPAAAAASIIASALGGRTGVAIGASGGGSAAGKEGSACARGRCAARSGAASACGQPAWCACGGSACCCQPACGGG